MIKKILKFLGITILVLIVLIGLLAAVSLRKVDSRHYTEKDYYKNTLKHFEQLALQKEKTSKEQLYVGMGRAGLTPPIGVPLAGFGDRKGAPSTGVHDSLFIRVIGLKSGDQSAFIIGYDALFVPPPLARQLEEKANADLGVTGDQLYYTATHTHSGPGGWSSGFVEEQFGGPPSPEVLPFFIDSTVAALKRAEIDFSPGSYKTVSVNTPEFIRNRLVGDKGKVDSELVTLVLYRNNKIAATFTTFSAHATTLSGKNMKFSGDYPGYFERKMEARTNSSATFAAAGLGSHSYQSRGKDLEKSAFVGNGLADSLIAHLDDGNFSESAHLESKRIPIEIDDHQIRLTNTVRLAPWLARKFIKPQEAYIQLLALDDFLLIGSPGEFSGELALDVKAYASQRGKKVTITSFNGCYIGYVTASKYYELNSYETRLMSWFGPYTGDYLVELMKKSIDLMNG